MCPLQFPSSKNVIWGTGEVGAPYRLYPHSVPREQTEGTGHGALGVRLKRDTIEITTSL